MFANQIGGSTTKIAGVNDSDYIEGIYQMYLNGVMEGDENREFGTLRNLTKAEAAKILEKSLFTLDEGLKNVKVINEGAANYIDFSLQDTYTINQDSYKSDSNEFYFVAPKTGYYYISDLNNCSVTVSDMKKREIKGLEAYDSATQITNGARYNILKGETAYINVNDAGTSYSFKISIPGDNELTFAPDRSGTFIYDNCPEYIIKDDLADYDKGNTCLITAENLSGSVTMASSHLIRKDVATLGDHSNCCGESKIRFDYLISNLTDSDVTIHINNIGIQTPGKSWSEDFTYKASAGFQEWSDYTGESITNPEIFIGNNIIQTSDGWNYKYMPYTSGTGEWSYNVNALRGKTIIIPPGETRWLLGDNRPVLDVGTTGYPFGMMINCSIDGVATVSSMVFHREDRVLSPHIGKIYSNSSVRDYSGEDYVGDDLGGKRRNRGKI